MILRCRAGDLAIVLRSAWGNEGKIVDVIEFKGSGLLNGIVTENLWRISIAGQERNWETGIVWAASDNDLLPIRPGDLDEAQETEKELEMAK